jgi:hypothetical protein
MVNLGAALFTIQNNTYKSVSYMWNMKSVEQIPEPIFTLYL